MSRFIFIRPWNKYTNFSTLLMLRKTDLSRLFLYSQCNNFYRMINTTLKTLYILVLTCELHEISTIFPPAPCGVTIYVLYSCYTLLTPIVVFMLKKGDTEDVITTPCFGKPAPGAHVIDTCLFCVWTLLALSSWCIYFNSMCRHQSNTDDIITCVLIVLAKF